MHLIMSTRNSSSSINKLRDSIEARDRVLVLGSSGWFGRTLASMLVGSQAEVLYVSSQTKVVGVDKTAVNMLAYNFKTISDFRPSVVIDFAFLTREKVDEFGLDRYKAVNDKLTHQLLEVAALGSVERVLVTSSGAAVYPPNRDSIEYEADPYGFLKARMELELENFARQSGKSVVCLRPWSVSGVFVTRPLEYAFSSIILQAMQGRVILESRSPVLRRYCAIDDLIALGLLELSDTSPGSFRVLDSGGELIDLISLSERVVGILANNASILHRVDPAAKPDLYYSDNQSWTDTSTRHSYRAKDLNTQISEMISYLNLD